MSVGSRVREFCTVPLRQYQVQGVRFVEAAGGRALIADDMGLGKSLEIAAWLMLHPEARPVVIVCPASVKYGWKRELWSKVRARSKVLEGRTPYRTKCEILIINYEILQWWVPTLIDLGAVVLVMDEVHKVKNRAAKRTKACRKLSRGCLHVIGASGTPITNAPVEYYPALEMIRPDLFESFSEFCWSFCDPRPGFGGRLDCSGASNLKKLRRLTRPFVIRRLKEDVLPELPKKQRIVYPVEITNRKSYERARDDFAEWLEEEEGEGALRRAGGALALVRLGKLLRLAALGKLPAVFEWVEDFLEETNRKLVIFAIHAPVIGALRERWPDAPCVDGSVPARERPRQVARFAKPRHRIFIGQLEAAGTGLDGLQVAQSTLTLEFPWNEALLNQSEDRVLRFGQGGQSVENYYLVARDTLEEWLLELIQEKKVVVDEVLEGKKPGARRNLVRLLEEAVRGE